MPKARLPPQISTAGTKPFFSLAVFQSLFNDESDTALVLFVKPRSTDLSCGEATLRTSPSSGQAAITCQLRHPYLLACHSRAAFGITPDFIL